MSRRRRSTCILKEGYGLRSLHANPIRLSTRTSLGARLEEESTRATPVDTAIPRESYREEEVVKE